MPDANPKKRQDTFTHKRMVWPYVLVEHPDGRREVEVRDAICPRCRARASYTQVGDRIVLSCHRCSISEQYFDFEDLATLKDHVRDLILASLD